MKQIVGIVIVLAFVATLLIVRAKRVRQKEGAPLAPVVTVAVQVAPVMQGKVIHSRHVLGTVIGADEADVAPQVMAQVLTVKVREGNVVGQGELLATLDPREFQDTVAEAEATLAAAQQAAQAQHRATARDRRLFEVKGIAQEDWDRSLAADAAATARLRAAERRLDTAKTRLSYTTIAAPMNGVVARRLADPGDLAVPGKALFKVIRQETVRVRAGLPPEDFPGLRVGQPVTLTLQGRTLDAAISRVFPAIGESHLASIECDLTHPPPGLVSGATVGLDVQLSSASGLVVPAEALLEGDNGTWVFAADNHVVRPVQVQVLNRSLEQVSVKGDIRLGEPVIVARPSRLMTLAAGMKVTVAAGSKSGEGQP
ncbi:MAG: efflux RND transporter periplasmic adaptor subunit [Verrucomicrobia bacterium]|nr:efflux RND transporter periplasmic adaptor subunit [Verrucomicrobiota bacterium]